MENLNFCPLYKRIPTYLHTELMVSKLFLPLKRPSLWGRVYHVENVCHSMLVVFLSMNITDDRERDSLPDGVLSQCVRMSCLDAI